MNDGNLCCLRFSPLFENTKQWIFRSSTKDGVITATCMKQMIYARHGIMNRISDNGISHCKNAR